MPRIAVLFAEGFEEVEAVTPLDFLRRAGVDAVLVGVSSPVPRGGHGIAVEADAVLGELEGPWDGVVLPGGMPGSTNLAESPAVGELCRNVMASGGLVAAICAAPAVALGAFGLLKGRRFTCYPGFENDVEGAVFSTDRVVVDGNLITSRGPGCAGEFAIELVRYLVDDDTADGLAGAGLIRS